MSVYKYTYVKRNSDKKMYPWQVLKSSKRVSEFWAESLRKQKTVTNISTTSRGLISDDSRLFCMFSMHKLIQPLAVNQNT